jgi:cold shock CspA family protein
MRKGLRRIMQGTIIWWSEKKSHGIISATENGKNERFFLHLQRIVSGPEKIKAGQHVSFEINPNYAVKDGLLRLAMSVVVSDGPHALNFATAADFVAMSGTAKDPQSNGTECSGRIGNDLCRLQKDHTGKHKDGGSYWTDADTVEYNKKFATQNDGGAK